jgi:molybdopterin-binding protein
MPHEYQCLQYVEGRVKHVTPGAVDTEVTIALPGGTEIVSIITKRSAERLQVSPGKEWLICAPQK